MPMALTSATEGTFRTCRWRGSTRGLDGRSRAPIEEDNAMASEESAQRKAHVAHALEVTIHIGLVVLLLFACFLILRPFRLIILWGVIIAVASYPAYRKLVGFLGGRGGLGAVVYVLL